MTAFLLWILSLVLVWNVVPHLFLWSLKGVENTNAGPQNRFWPPTSKLGNTMSLLLMPKRKLTLQSLTNGSTGSFLVAD